MGRVIDSVLSNSIDHTHILAKFGRPSNQIYFKLVWISLLRSLNFLSYSGEQ